MFISLSFLLYNCIVVIVFSFVHVFSRHQLGSSDHIKFEVSDRWRWGIWGYSTSIEEGTRPKHFWSMHTAKEEYSPLTSYFVFSSRLYLFYILYFSFLLSVKILEWFLLHSHIHQYLSSSHQSRFNSFKNKRNNK